MINGRAVHPYGARRERGREPSAEDLARFGELVSAAERAAADPEGGAEALAKARARCKGRIMPRSQQVVGSPLGLLCGLALGWGGLGVAGRAAQAEQLKTLAARCRLVLDPAPTRPRADLEG